MSLDNVSLKYLKFANIFVEKNVRSFCTAKASPIFQTKNIGMFGYKVIKRCFEQFGPDNLLLEHNIIFCLSILAI